MHNSHVRGAHPEEMQSIKETEVSAPRLIWLPLFVFLVVLLGTGCEEQEEWVENPLRYLKTEGFPGYIQRIPFFGVNGHSGLKQMEPGSPCSVSGIYVERGSDAFIRTFNDSVLVHIPLKGHLPYSSEVILVEVEGTVAHKGESYLSDVQVLSAQEIEKLHQRVMVSYPELMEKIADAVEDPKSKLDLKTIETFHCAAREDELLIFGRTYDLMYEFDLALLFQRKHGKGEENKHNSFHIKHIYAHLLFKAE